MAGGIVEMFGSAAALGVTMAPVFVIAMRWLDGRYSRRLAQCELDRKDLSTRITAIEIQSSSDIPKWVRTQDGIILSCSPEFVRVFGAPHGYRTRDIVGATFEKLTAFSPELRRTLAEMEREVLAHRYAHRSGVPVSPDVRATIIKTSYPGAGGDVMFIGWAVPELD